MPTFEKGHPGSLGRQSEKRNTVNLLLDQLDERLRQYKDGLK
jgi:hypothetical protein